MDDDFFSKWKVRISLIMSILTILGVILFAKFSTNTVSSIKEAPSHFTDWHEQLPDTHWIKTNDTYWAEIQMLSLKSFIELSSRLTINQTIETTSQALDPISSFIFNIVVEDYKHQLNTLYLMDLEYKKVKRITLKQGDSNEYFFGENEAILPFDVSEAEFNSGLIPILSYIEDPEIATINNGVITGKSQGKTNLIICFGGNQYSYRINVK